MAQSDSPQPDTQQRDSSQAASSEVSSGEEYSGPAILSRGQTPALQTVTPIAFRPYIGVSGIYDTGLLPVAVTSTGQIPSTDAYGVALSLGAYTYHAWRDTTLGLDYRGDFRHYSTTYSDGTDHSLSLTLTHRPTRRVTFTLRSQAGLYSLNNYSLSAPLGGLNSNYLQLPQNDIFDNRVIFAGASGDLTYSLSPRLSFNVGASSTLVRRQSSALYGSTGVGAHGDLEYRLSRHTTVGADYRYMYFGYTRGFGNSEIHSVGVNYSTQLSPHLQLSARIGGARVESVSLIEVTLDPAVAALLGETVGIQAANRLNFVSDMQAQLAYTLHRSGFTLAYFNGVTPGNGIYNTSRNSSESASYSYSGVHYWSFGVNANYARMTTLVQTIGAYTSYGAGVGITRDLAKGLHAVLRIDGIHYDIASGALFRRITYQTSLGVSFSPGDLPLVLW